MFSFYIWGPVEATPVYHSYLSAVGAVFFGAIIAFIYTRYLNRKVSERETLVEFSDDLRHILELCEECWLGDWDNGPKDELQKRACVLSSRLAATGEYRPLMKRLLGKSFEEFDNLDVRLTMRATGGCFQTSNMKSSPETFQEICFVVFKTEHILRDLRSRR